MYCGCGQCETDCSACPQPLVSAWPAGGIAMETLAEEPACGPGPTILQRMAPMVARIRSKTRDRLGLTPWDVYLIWEQWSGAERGEGRARLLASVKLLPRPVVSDLSSVALQGFSGGVVPVGSIRVDGISLLLTADNLLGRTLPNPEFFASLGSCAQSVGEPPPGVPASLMGLRADEAALVLAGAMDPGSPRRIPDRVSFFWEVVEVGVKDAERMRFRAASLPTKRRNRADWSLVLERADEDRSRAGRNQAGVNED